jgi:hypothetical protein
MADFGKLVFDSSRREKDEGKDLSHRPQLAKDQRV